MKSTLKHIGQVPFPEWTGEKAYMIPFTRDKGLPKSLARWLPTVQAMCLGLYLTEGSFYIMIDQSEIKAGTTHRRPGPHIDGNWYEGRVGHTGGHGTGIGRHRTGSTYPSWNTGGGLGTDSPPKIDDIRWNTDGLKTEAIVLASDVAGCMAYVGEVKGVPGKGGDCSHLNLNHMEKVLMQPGHAYIGNVTMIHESIPVQKNCRRTLVRLNLPNVTF